MRIKEILDWLDSQKYPYRFIGDESVEISGFSSLADYKPGTLTWVKKERTYAECGRPENLQCAVVQTDAGISSAGMIISPASKTIFFAILEHFWGSSPYRTGTGKGTFLIGDIHIPPDVSIGCGCIFRGDICIGEGTVIEDHVTILNRVTIGRNCLIHAGAVIGKDGFGFSFTKENVPRKVVQFGGVRIGNRVEIGANTVIDRGTIGDTYIGDDTKIDSLCLIAHNVRIGKAVMVAGQTDVAGSVQIGDKSYIAPGGIIKNQVRTGNSCFTGMGVTIRHDMPDHTAAILDDGKMVTMRDYRRFL